MKSNFNVCHDMFEDLSGFAWNSMTKMFEVEHEVWSALIEVSFI